MTQPLEIILMRELAGHLATPIFVVDPEGDLLFYNDPAEKLLGSRFDETGMMPFAEWSTVFTPTDEHDVPIRPRNCRWRSQRNSVSRRKAACGFADSTADVAISLSRRFPWKDSGENISARRQSFGKRSEPHDLGDTRLAGCTGSGHGAIRRQYLVHRTSSDSRDAGRARCRHRHAAPGHRTTARGAPRRRVVDASAYGPHSGTRILRALVSTRFRGAHMGARFRHCRSAVASTRYMSPPLFPVRLPELPCDLHLHDLNEDSIAVPGLGVRARSYATPVRRSDIASRAHAEPSLICLIMNRCSCAVISANHRSGARATRSQPESTS